MSSVASAACTRAYTVHAVAPLGYNVFYDQKGELAGLMPDVMRELSRRTGCVFKYEIVPPARLSQMRTVGRYEIMALARNRKEPTWEYVPMMSSTTDLVVLDTLHVTTAEEALANPELRFGKVAGLYYGVWGENFISKLKPEQVDVSPSVDSLYRKLKAGRINATIGFPVLYLYNLDTADLRQDVRIISVEEAPRLPGGIGFSPENVAAPDRKLLEAAAEEMRKDGFMQKILTRWVGESIARKQLWVPERDDKLLQ